MALWFFVRSIDRVLPAVAAGRRFLAYQQRHLEGSRQSDEPLVYLDKSRFRCGASSMLYPYAAFVKRKADADNVSAAVFNLALEKYRRERSFNF